MTMLVPLTTASSKGTTLPSAFVTFADRMMEADPSWDTRLKALPTLIALDVAYGMNFVRCLQKSEGKGPGLE